MQFEVLGPLRVVGPEGDPVTLASAAQRRLLSLLILRAGGPVSSDFLGEHLDVSAGALRVAVSRLRRIVGFDTLVTAPPGYELRTESIDVGRFEQLLATAAQQKETARTALSEALELWRGDPYAEFAHEEWALAEIRRLTEIRAGALEDLVELLLVAGEWTEAIATLEPLIEEQPYRDRPRSQLMRALADSGRRIDALRTYQAYRKLLAEEVGTDPSEGITALDREIASSGATGIESTTVIGESFGVFLMTDIVGSTRLWADHPEAMAADLALHDDVLSRAIVDHGGVTIAKGGDSFVASFDNSGDAVAAAVVAQELLAASTWHTPDGIQVRMGVHLGAAQRRGDGWYGPPLNEAARMMAVAHGGQIVASKVIAEEVRGVSFVDLGEHRLRDLDGTHHLFQVVVPGMPTEFPSLRSMGRYVTTLPAQRTTLIGRDDFITRIRALLLDHRLVSLIGPGGVGKTRAAVEVAGQELANFPGGVFFVDLTTAVNDAEVLAAVVSGVRTSVPPDVSVTEHLAAFFDRRALLVVDNCEHVVDQAAEVIDSLLSAVRDLRALATSREALLIHGEHCLEVPSLDVAGPASSGVRLFTDRALATDNTLVIADMDLEAVAQIARRLDGIPLAIELAAAQTRSLTAPQILTHLDDRFTLLTRGTRQAPPRQRTLEATVAWSYDLLDRDQQFAFRRLAVCAGPFALGTAARLLGVDDLDAARLLDALVGKSLISTVRFSGGSQGYRFLETLRDYGRRALVEAGELDDAEMALERGLLPSAELLGDWVAMVNDYICPSDVNIVIEDATRRDAAERALAAGRLDAAALIFSSCAFRDDHGVLDIALRLVAPLADRRDELDPIAWRAAVAAKLGLERLTRRYIECFATAVDMLANLDADDPARGWFDVWECALTSAIAPEQAITMVDAVLPAVRGHARAPFDYSLSQLLITKATSLATMRRFDEALEATEEGLAWAPIGGGSRDQGLALLLWILYATGAKPDPRIRDEVGALHLELGFAELCAAPAALCSDLPVEERAAELVALARRRQLPDAPTPFLFAFAWLAIEEGDHARAAGLVAKAELYDSSTQVALLQILATLHGWTDETWALERDAAIGLYLSPEHDLAAKQGSAALAVEVDEWEWRLLQRQALQQTENR